MLLLHKRKDDEQLVNGKSIRRIVFVAYRNILLAVPNETPTETILLSLRYIFGSKNVSIRELINNESITEEQIYYRIPYTSQFINSSYNIIDIKTTQGNNLPFKIMPYIIDTTDYKIDIVQPEYEYAYTTLIGTFTLEEYYNFGRHFIYLPNAILNEEVIPNIQKWYKSIAYVERNEVQHPILVGEDILFANYVNKDNRHIQLGFSPEYPNIMLRKMHSAMLNLEEANIISSYKYIYMYMVFSSTMPKLEPLRGYIAFEDYDHIRENIIHLPVQSFGHNLTYVDLPYLIISAFHPGRTIGKPVPTIENNKLLWDSGDDIYSGINVKEKNDYTNKLNIL